MITRVSEGLGTSLCTELDTKIEGGVRQQLDSLLPAVLESEVQASMDTVQTNWIASLERRLRQLTEMVARTIINTLFSDLNVFIGGRISGQIQSFVDSTLPNTDFSVNQIRV